MAARHGLTRRQHEVLLMVQELAAAGRPPTPSQIAGELAISGAGRAYQILCALRRGGWIDWPPDWPLGAGPARLRVLRALPPPAKPPLLVLVGAQGSAQEAAA